MQSCPGEGTPGWARGTSLPTAPGGVGSCGRPLLGQMLWGTSRPAGTSGTAGSDTGNILDTRSGTGWDPQGGLQAQHGRTPIPGHTRLEPHIPCPPRHGCLGCSKALAALLGPQGTGARLGTGWEPAPPPPAQGAYSLCVSLIRLLLRQWQQQAVGCLAPMLCPTSHPGPTALRKRAQLCRGCPESSCCFARPWSWHRPQQEARPHPCRTGAWLWPRG